ncbi:MAG: hypothetical protein NT045_00415 [Candidatus Aureabacteria bacterium]|nr:hypothetical protein [Candidatus Auribacterota bacterium]
MLGGFLRRVFVWALLLGPAAATPAVCGAEQVSLQDVNGYPELYAGGSLDLEGVTLDGTIHKDQGYYCLSVAAEDDERSRGAERRGEYTPPFLNKGRVTFVAPPDVARRFLDSMDAGTVYTVSLRFTVGRVEVLGNAYWLASVCDFTVHGAGTTTAGGGGSVRDDDNEM